ncbi:Uncharacterized protein BP5553_09527 [Venustampulla echinocandica]|uniref:Tat pathway signal sequence n=1 Tax=Venustampulla echinocandica TaxID=2656787 RepID=A0A370TD10_9HELO|nr:Uncharacterized protein BP5553_09527 [Venustampulla echinocandica]RDL32125.1 Uncharacterized protein BP5553_09527 [Venustampulla echinocandica]
MYTSLKGESEHGSSSFEAQEQLLSKGFVQYNSSTRNHNRILLHIFVAFMSTISAFALGVFLGSQKSAWFQRECITQVQKYSPILKKVDTSLHTVRFNGSLLKENVFRQSAGPEVDAAWGSIGVNYRSLAVPASEATESGLLLDQVKISSRYGGGFPANVEGLHHLHCLDLLRQALYFNYDYYHARGNGAFKNKDNIVRFHVTHCLDIIRQQLMCMPDTGLLGQVWWDLHAPKAFVDFNTEHKCKNFEAIRQWAEERQIPKQVPNDFLQPPQEGDRIYEEIP